MRVLVIGGTRFIGPAVVGRLSALGHQVTVLHRGQTEVELPHNVQHLHSDRALLGNLAGEFQRLLPDVVIDMAAYTEQDALAVLHAFRGAARRLVVVSSQDVYRAYGRFHGKEAGVLEPVPITEDAPLREQLYPYRGTGRGLDDYEKILAERTAVSSPVLPATILRLPMVFGERDEQRRLLLELTRMDDGRPAILLEYTFALWRWTRGYVENIAAAIALASTDDRASGRVYNLGEPNALSYADWVRAIGRASGWPGEVIVLPDGRLPPQLHAPFGDYEQHLVADTSRIRGELGFIEPVPLDDALRRTIAWERANRSTGRPRFDYAAEDAVLTDLGRVPAPP